MKQLIIAVAMLGMSINNGLAQNVDFRGFAWGSSLEKVEATEKAKLKMKIKNDELIYEDQLAGSDCEVCYTFNDNNKLIDGLYVFTKRYDNPQLYLQDYNKFKMMLTEKYGVPNSEKENWHNNTQPVDKQNYGQAIANGNLTLNTQWEANCCSITIRLVTFNNRPSLQIIYTTKDLNVLENQEAIQDAMKKL